MKKLDLASAVLSFELKSQRVRDLSKPLDTELIVYGRLPLMIMENCIIRGKNGRCACHWKTGGDPVLTDRRRARFPVVHAYGCRNEILNSAPVYLADKGSFWQHCGLWRARLLFTTESGADCAEILRQYQTDEANLPEQFTRGLYFRDVE